MPRTHLTEAFVHSDEARCPDGRSSYEFNCMVVIGLYLAVTRNVHKTYRFAYKDEQNRRRHLTLGNASDMTLKEARAKALLLRAEVIAGRDPAAERREQQSVPLLKDFFKDQYMPYSKQTKRSHVSDESLGRVHVIPEFGSYRMDKVTRKSIVAYQIKIRERGLAPATCNRIIALIRVMYSRAVEWEVVKNNPVKGIKLFHEENRLDKSLSDAELGRLLHVLRTDSNRVVCNVGLFLLATGARKSEALHARWEHIDEAARRWTIPASNAKSKKVRSVPLNDTALDVLRSLHGRERNEWLFISSRGERLTCIKKVWERLSKAAGVPHLNPHRLRHTAAHMLINSGRTLYEVQNQLGHSSPTVTQKYSALSTATMQDAANSIDTVLQRAEANSVHNNPN